MLAVGHVEIGIILYIHHLVVALRLVTGPVDIFIYLDIGDGTAGIFRDAKGLVEMIGPHRGLGAALRVVLILTEAVLPDKPGSLQHLLPVSVLVPLMHGDGCSGQLLSHCPDHEELGDILILCLRKGFYPVRRLLHTGNGGIEFLRCFLSLFL